MTLKFPFDPEDDLAEPGGETAAPQSEMSAEEQMAAYEEALKNDDWGHQPC